MGELLEYFRSNRAPHLEGKARNFPKSQGKNMGGKLYTKTRTSLRSSKSQGQSLYMEWSLEFFQVSWPLYKENGVYDDSYLTSLGTLPC